MNKKKILSLFSGVSALALVAMAIFWAVSEPAKSSAPPGLQVNVATSSTFLVGNIAKILTATTTCSARIITTTGNAVMLSWYANALQGTSTPIIGTIQAASTTVAYDAETYGCGQMSVIGVTLSNGTEDQITFIETR